MASVGTIWSSLKLNISDFSTKLNTASGQLRSFSKTVNGQTNNARQAMKNLQKGTEAYGLTLKSVSRIVSGIIISQAFYTAVQDIKRATSAVWEFSSSLEYAKIVYTNLFNDGELADEFINVLKDFAALSPFDFTESEQAAKRLLAYGVQYKNVMYMMQGVMSAAAMQGDSTKVESISRALGQIYTKGRLMNEEMRQLAEAGIPAYEILKEKLGLTQKQLQNLGNESIPASKAINALVDGMTERFGNVSNASTKTMTGLISNLKDNATMLASGIFTPMYENIKSVVGAIGDLAYSLREIYELKGSGGVFEAIVPPELQSTLRMFIANLMNLGHTIGNIMQALNSLLRPAILGVVMAFNMVAPVVTNVLNALSAMIYIVASNEAVMKGLAMAVAAAAAMWVAYKAKLIIAAAASAVIKGMSMAVAGLSVALTFVVAHPFWALLLVLIGTIAALTGTFNKLGDAIRGVFSKLTAFSGVDPDKLLLPSQKERANDVEKFNQKLDDTADSMDDLADKTNKAKKNLLSFDEVFRLTSTDETGNSGINTDISIPDVDFGDMDAYVPEVPSFDGWENDYVDKINKAFENIKKAFEKGKKVLDSLPLTTMFAPLAGILIGSKIGGPIGGVIGGMAGLLGGSLVDELIDYFETGDIHGIATSFGGLVGMGIGAIIGGPVGSIIGGLIGTLAGWLVDELILAIEDGDGTKASLISMGIGGLLGGALGFVIAGPAGALVGAGVTAVAGFLMSELIQAISEKDSTKITLMSTGLGTAIGAGIGAIVGGPAGALIGAGIGTLVGWITGEITDGITTGNWEGVGLSIGTSLGGVIGFLVGGPAGALIGAGIGALVGWIGDEIAATDWAAVGESITNWAAETDEAISTWAAETKARFGEWFIETTFNLGTWILDTKGRFNTWKAETAASFTLWATETKTNFDNWKTETKGKFDAWKTETFAPFNEWKAETAAKIGAWKLETSEKFNAWKADASETFNKWKLDTALTVANWYLSVKGKIEEFLGMSFKDWCRAQLQELKDWANGVWEAIKDKIGKAIDKVKEFFNVKNSDSDITINTTNSTGTRVGHATGGIFNREHVARFAEGNKAEAIIPLENNSAMQPFVDAVSNGLTASLAPIIANINGSQQLQPLYVGTLIADDRSLKELERKMNVIKLQESRRR